MKGHGAGVITEKCMRIFFCSIWSPIVFCYVCSSSLFCASYRTAIGIALVWSKRGCTIKTMWSNELFEGEKIYDLFRTLELPIHAGLLIFIPHIVCVLMYSNVYFWDILLFTSGWGPFKSVWQQLRIYRRQSGLVEKYNVSLRKLLQQGTSEPEFYGDLVTELEKKYGEI